MSRVVDSARIFKLVRQKAYDATLATMEKAAQNALMRMRNHWKARNITGNAWTSFSIGVFYKGRLVSEFYMADNAKEPTRVTLRKGERYLLKYFYNGDRVANNVYEGTDGRGGQWGPTLGKWTLHRLHSPKRATWNIVFIIPVSYAEFNPHLIESMNGLMGDLPNIVDYSVVTVNRAPAQTDIFKDVPF